jgi:hypothetical protein
LKPRTCCVDPENCALPTLIPPAANKFRAYFGEGVDVDPEFYGTWPEIITI